MESRMLKDEPDADDALDSLADEAAEEDDVDEDVSLPEDEDSPSVDEDGSRDALFSSITGIVDGCPCWFLYE